MKLKRIRRIGFPREVRPGYTLRESQFAAYFRRDPDPLWIVERHSARYLWIRPART